MDTPVINLEHMKPGTCPLCGAEVERGTSSVTNIHLSDTSVMPCPTCESCYQRMETKTAQEAYLTACKVVWKREILSSTQLSELEKDVEIARVDALEVVYDDTAHTRTG